MQKSLLTRIGETIDQHRQEQRIHESDVSTAPRPSQLPTILRWFLPNGGTLLLIALLIFTQNVWAGQSLRSAAAEDAASTGTIAYQGRLADSNGQPIVAASHPMVFRLYASDAADATPLWTENWTGSNAVEVSDGLFNVMLGSLDPIPQGVITGNDSLFLGISVGSDDEMTPRIQLGTVPYASQALTVPDGSITTAKLASGSVTQDKLDPTLDLVPAGAIIMWSGAIGSVPTGWQICDGSNGTPDLRDRFIVGAGSTYAVGATGGAAEVTLSVAQMPAHNHSASTNQTGGIEFSRTDRHGGGIYYGTGTIHYENNSSMGNHSHSVTVNNTGGGQAHENRPPYYALALICKQ